MSSRTWSVRSAKLLQDEKLGSVVLRLMMAMNDIGITNSSMVEWEKTDDPKKKLRRHGGVLYLGRVQSAHLFEALSIIDEIKKDGDLMAAVDRADLATQKSFQTIAKFLDGDDYNMMAKMRNVVAFHYEPKLTLRRLQKLVEKSPDHSMPYSLGTETLDWYFELVPLRSPFLRSLIAATNASAFFLLPWVISFVRPRRRLSSAATVDFGRRRAQRLSRPGVAPSSRHAALFCESDATEGCGNEAQLR